MKSKNRNKYNRLSFSSIEAKPILLSNMNQNLYGENIKVIALKGLRTIEVGNVCTPLKLVN